MAEQITLYKTGRNHRWGLEVYKAMDEVIKNHPTWTNTTVIKAACNKLGYKIGTDGEDGLSDQHLSGLKFTERYKRTGTTTPSGNLAVGGVKITPIAINADKPDPRTDGLRHSLRQPPAEVPTDMVNVVITLEYTVDDGSQRISSPVLLPKSFVDKFEAYAHAESIVLMEALKHIS